MKYVKSIIRLIGYGRYDESFFQCQEITLESHQLRVIEEKVKEGHEVKKVVKEWLEDNADLSEITDFMADLAGNEIVNWNDPVNERVFDFIEFGRVVEA
jgi:hypothetical protein